MRLQVKLLVEVGAADPCLPDRWKQTALDEARRAGAVPVVAYLTSKVPGVIICWLITLLTRYWQKCSIKTGYILLRSLSCIWVLQIQVLLHIQLFCIHMHS